MLFILFIGPRQEVRVSVWFSSVFVLYFKTLDPFFSQGRRPQCSGAHQSPTAVGEHPCTVKGSNPRSTVTDGQNGKPSEKHRRVRAAGDAQQWLLRLAATRHEAHADCHRGDIEGSFRERAASAPIVVAPVPRLRGDLAGLEIVARRKIRRGAATLSVLTGLELCCDGTLFSGERAHPPCLALPCLPARDKVFVQAPRHVQFFFNPCLRKPFSDGQHGGMKPGPRGTVLGCSDGAHSLRVRNALLAAAAAACGTACGLVFNFSIFLFQHAQLFRIRLRNSRGRSGCLPMLDSAIAFATRPPFCCRLSQLAVPFPYQARRGVTLQLQPTAPDITNLRWLRVDLFILFLMTRDGETAARHCWWSCLSHHQVLLLCDPRYYLIILDHWIMHKPTLKLFSSPSRETTDRPCLPHHHHHHHHALPVPCPPWSRIYVLASDGYRGVSATNHRRVVGFGAARRFGEHRLGECGNAVCPGDFHRVSDHRGLYHVVSDEQRASSRARSPGLFVCPLQQRYY